MSPSTRLIRPGLLLLASLLAILVPWGAEASGSRIRTIDKPTVITRPGTYHLKRGLRFSGTGPAIVIRSDNVTLDLQGHSLTGPEGAAALGTIGISVERAQGVQVTNGVIARFGIGVQAVGSTNVRFEGLRINGQDLGGTPPSVEIGIHLLDSRGVRVTRNLVTRTFLGIFVRGEGSSGNTLRDNTVTGGDNAALGICYNPGLDGTGGPQGDLVYNNHIARFRVGIQITSRARSNLFVENFIYYLDRSFEDLNPGGNLLEGNKGTAASP